MTSAIDGNLIFDVAVGLGVLLMGIGIFVATLALAKSLKRLGATLDEVDRQMANLGKPVADTLEHVEAIAETADRTLTRLGAAAGALESAAQQVSQTTTLAKEALSPAIVNVGAALTGVSAGLRRLLTGKNATDRP